MTQALATAAGFFLAITVTLHFSTWAEDWLVRNARPIRVDASDALASAAGAASEPRGREAIRAS